LPFTINFGPVRLQWILDESDPRWREFLDAYRPHSDAQEGELKIEAEVADVSAGSPRPPLPRSFIRTRVVTGRDFELGEGLVRGSLSEPGRLRCTIHPALLSGTGLRVCEQFFYLLFHHAALAGAPAEREAPFLLHSSGVLHRGRVHAFCGPAGSGKSTAAALCPARPLLSDETLVFTRAGDGFLVVGSPINPFCGEKSPGQGPLEQLYLIEHGPEHRLLPVRSETVVPRLTAEVIVPLGLFEADLRLGLARCLDRALLLLDSGRVRRLAFRPDPGFWNLLV